MLTARNLKTLPAGDYTDSVAEGLTLRVRPSGRRRAVRYRAKLGAGRGPQRRLHFGEVGGPVTLDLAALELGGFVAPAELGLEAARGVARALTGLAARGVDPMEALAAADRARRKREADAKRRREQGTVTLGALLARFLDEGKATGKRKRGQPLRPATLANWRGLALGVLAPLRDRDPATLTATEVEAFHAGIGESGRPVLANRALELLGVLYGWSMKTRDASGTPLLAASPVKGIEPFPETPRDRVLDSGELRAVLGALEGEPYSDPLKLSLWTGARKSEALGAERAEFDLKARLWRVPASRSKTGAARLVPLSSPACAMLGGRFDAAPGRRWAFPSPVAAVGPVRSLQAALARVQARSGVTGWSLHDFRRTLRTGLGALGVTPGGRVRSGPLGPADDADIRQALAARRGGLRARSLGCLARQTHHRRRGG